MAVNRQVESSNLSRGAITFIYLFKLLCYGDMMAPRKKSKKSTVRKAPAKKAKISPVIRVEQEWHKIAHYAFLAGICLAVIVGLFKGSFDSLLGIKANYVYVTTFVLLGTIVGIFNLTAKETQPFLIASIALMLGGIVNLGYVYLIGDLLRNVLSNIVVFVVPAAIVVSLKSIWLMASR